MIPNVFNETEITERAATIIARAATPLYPRHLEREVTLRDRRRVFVRPVRSDDDERLAEFFARISPRSMYERFLCARRSLPPAWIRQFATVDYRARLGLIAEPVAPGPTPIIALGQYEGMPTGAAEVAFIVRDDWQGCGLGTHLLDRIVAAATDAGFAHLQAWVHADNLAMLRVVNRGADVVARAGERGVVELMFRRRMEVR